MFFRLSKPAKAGLCHALICILIITLTIKAAAELPVTQNFNSSNCWGVGGGGGGGGCTCMQNYYSDRPICMDVATSI